MKVNRKRLEIAMANECLNAYAVSEKACIQYQTFRKMLNGCECKPATVGKVAKVLNVKVENLV